MSKLCPNPKKFGKILPIAGGILLLGALSLLLFFNSTEKQEAAQYEARIQSLSLKEILADRGLTHYANLTSQKLFINYCASCHGEGGKGDKTAEGLFAPVLNDKDWLFDGRVENIYGAIANGLHGFMPAYRKKLSASQIDDLAKYVQALSEGQPERETAGKKVYSNSGCAPCHGENGKGVPQVGGANLTDNIWRFDGSLAGIKRSIAYGVNSNVQHDRVSEMPEFKSKLTSNEIKKLAVYVYQLNEKQH